MENKTTGITLDIDIFQGVKTKDSPRIDEFLKQFEAAAETAGLVTDEQKASHFGNYLWGDPLCLYQNLDLAEIDPKEWKKVKEYFLTKFQIFEETVKLTKEKIIPEHEDKGSSKKETTRGQMECLNSSDSQNKENSWKNNRRRREKKPPPNENQFRRQEIGILNENKSMSNEGTKRQQINVIETNELITSLVTQEPKSKAS